MSEIRNPELRLYISLAGKCAAQTLKKTVILIYFILFKLPIFLMILAWNLAEVTAQQHKVNLKNGKSYCRLWLEKRVLLSNSVKNDTTLCLFKHIIVVEIKGEWSILSSD